MVKQWQIDEEIKLCNHCSDLFTLVKRKHHCRICGKIFCDACTRNVLLIPKEVLFQSDDLCFDACLPHRTCNFCAQTVLPFQSELQSIAKSNKVLPVRRQSALRYMNHPISFSMEDSITKAVYTLYNCTGDNIISGSDKIPRELLLKAHGIAFITVAKVGLLLSGRYGTGLVVSKLSDGSWSAPSAVSLTGLGWGFQAGIDVTDVMLVLNSTAAVDTFCSHTQVVLGTEVGISVGPVGRSAGTDVHGGDMGVSSAIFSYSHSKGVFMGLSLEASVVVTRTDVNRAFYGLTVKPYVLLSAAYPRPIAAEPLYAALAEVLADIPSSSHGSNIYDNYMSTIQKKYQQMRHIYYHGPIGDGNGINAEGSTIQTKDSGSSGWVVVTTNGATKAAITVDRVDHNKEANEGFVTHNHNDSSAAVKMLGLKASDWRKYTKYEAQKLVEEEQEEEEQEENGFSEITLKREQQNEIKDEFYEEIRF